MLLFTRRPIYTQGKGLFTHWLGGSIGHRPAKKYSPRMLCFVAHFMTTSVSQNMWRRIPGWSVSNELERIWIEVVVAQSRSIQEFSWRDWVNPRETSVSIVGFPVEVRTEHLPNKIHNITTAPAHSMAYAKCKVYTYFGFRNPCLAVTNNEGKETRSVFTLQLNLTFHFSNSAGFNLL
jgi:hypothetical protein